MSNRERWIIYPLLFFAIMIGVADLWQRSGGIVDLAGPPRFYELRCQQLILEDRNEQPIAVLNQNKFGEVQLSMLHNDGAAVIMKASQGGGDLLLLRQADQQAIYLGHDADYQFSGLQAAEITHGRITPIQRNGKQIELLAWPGQSWETEESAEQEQAD
jgi:hypothetical protein